MEKLGEVALDIFDNCVHEVDQVDSFPRALEPSALRLLYKLIDYLLSTVVVLAGENDKFVYQPSVDHLILVKPSSQYLIEKVFQLK